MRIAFLSWHGPAAFRAPAAQPALPHVCAGRYLSSPVSGKTAEQLHNTPPEELGFNDLPPAVRACFSSLFFPACANALTRTAPLCR